MTRDELVQKLRRAPGLRRAPVAALRALAAAGRVETVPAGTTLFEEHDGGKSVFLVLRGTVRISKRLDEGQEAQIASRGSLEWIGELTLIDDGPRSATATVDSRAELLEVPRARFVGLLRDHPDAALDLLRFVTGRLRESDGALTDALRKRTEELLAANARLGAEVKRLRRGEGRDALLEDAFVGRSAHAGRVRKAASRAARGSASALLVGEAGTGKELLARAIHGAGARREGPFVALDGNLFRDVALQAELFGHARGALPGVPEARPGAIEEADGGTLYVGHLDGLSRPVQDQLFRFLETADFSRTGDATTRSADVRVLAGIAGDPEEAVREGRLRADLLARLDVVRIAIPPLRARRTDIPLLALRVVDEVAARLECAPLALAPSALRVLARYDFPNDNADELAGDIEELYATLGAGANVSSRDLPAKFVQGDPSTSEHYSEAVRAFKAQIITNAVHEAGGSRVRAAERLGLHPSNLSRMVRDLGLDEVL